MREYFLNSDICIDMNSKRQQKVARVLQKELSDIFQRDLRDTFGKAFITITDTEITPDLGVAYVYLSFMMVNNKEEALQDVRDTGSKIRGILGQRVRHQLRIVPELRFFLDDTADHAAKMDKLFSQIDIPKDPTDEQKGKDA